MYQVGWDKAFNDYSLREESANLCHMMGKQMPQNSFLPYDFLLIKRNANVL